jgi:hypothetical protein
MVCLAYFDLPTKPGAQSMVNRYAPEKYASLYGPTTRENPYWAIQNELR